MGLGLRLGNPEQQNQPHQETVVGMIHITPGSDHHQECALYLHDSGANQRTIK